MVDNNYLTLIEQGVEHWNRWRADNPDIEPNLCQAYLFDFDLSGANLSNANLNGACLVEANLKNASLSQASLKDAYLNGANLSGANLESTELSCANFSGANLTHANLSKAHADATNFKGAQLAGANLKDWRINPATQLDGNSIPAKADAVGTGYSSADAIVKQPQLQISIRLDMASVLMGIGALVIGVAFIGGLTNFGSQESANSSPQASTGPLSLSSLPCSEPMPPPLPDQPPDYIYANGAIYYGNLVEGVPANGRGIMVFANGDRYDGDYQNGKRNGCGTFVFFASGRTYMGQFQNDNFNGSGVWTFENGDRYIGEFKNNKCSGRGTFILAGGSIKSGTWQNGGLIGNGLSCDRGPTNEPGSTAQ